MTATPTSTELASGMPAKGQASSRAKPHKILVWDAPVRVFHWLMVVCFAGAMITQEMESLRAVHVTLGYTMAGLVVFRIIWGLIGTSYARFGSFVPRPSEIKAYVVSMFTRSPRHYLGHNPLGALSVLAMLALTLLITASGYVIYEDLGGDLFEELHEGAANLMLAIVGLHVAGVVMSSLRHKENLVRAMIDGYKLAVEGAGIKHRHLWLALAMLAAVGYFWIVSLR